LRDHVERDAGLEVIHGGGMVNTGVKGGEGGWGIWDLKFEISEVPGI
jgi:hypothetical protein